MSEHRHSADVIVVGSGPAGIAAVCRLLPAGRRVIWVDQQTAPGGQIWRAGTPAAWAAKLAALARHPGLLHLPGHSVVAAATTAIRQDLLLHHFLDPQADGVRVSAPQLLLCLGARERFLPFPGWTLPGVHGAGGLQALIKNGWPIARQRVVLAGSGPLLLAAADTARQAGAVVQLIAEQASTAALARFAAGLGAAKLRQAAGLAWRLRGLPYRRGCWVVRALGEQRLEAVVLSDGQREWTLACDALGLGMGLLPNTELAGLLGCRIEAGAIAVDTRLQSSQPGIFAAGECTGIGGVDKALIEGELASLSLLGQPSAGLLRQRRQALAFARRLQRTFALRPELAQLADAKTLICRCEDVTLGELKAQRGWRDAKLQTRCGMGACQGRICGPITRELLGWESVEQRGQREPLQPAPVKIWLGGG